MLGACTLNPLSGLSLTIQAFVDLTTVTCRCSCTEQEELVCHCRVVKEGIARIAHIVTIPPERNPGLF